MTDPFETPRNNAAGMPGHPMSADVGVREAGGEVLDRLRTEIERQCLIGAGMFEVDEGWAQSGLWGINADLDPAGLRAALNAPTESVKAPEGVGLIAWASPGQMAALADPQDGDGSGAYLPLRRTSAGNFTMPLYASPTPITADDAVAKERERCAKVIDAAAADLREAMRQARTPEQVDNWRLRIAGLEWLATAIRSLSPDTEGEG